MELRIGKGPRTRASAIAARHAGKSRGGRVQLSFCARAPGLCMTDAGRGWWSDPRQSPPTEAADACCQNRIGTPPLRRCGV